VKLIAQLKLLPTPEQAEALRATLETANAGCDYVSRVAWERNTFREYALRKLVYGDLRATYGLGAQIAQHCVAKVSDAYAHERTTRHTFKPHGSIAFDDRNLSYALPDGSVSIWTVRGRERIPFVCGERQWQVLQTRRGESDLVYSGGRWYLLATCEVEEPAPGDLDDALGVDLGVVNIATDSDGEIHSGRAINNVRARHRRLRTKLQTKGTKGARRRLKLLAGKERRFARHTNHGISKRIVAKAERTTRGLALEDLRGIRTRARARKPQRATLHSWSFAQLRAFLTYKARRAGVRVVLVDPRNTSRTCPVCGCVDRRNRPSQSVFSCVRCGFAGLADTIAAVIIRRAAVSRPDCSDLTRSESARAKPTSLSGGQLTVGQAGHHAAAAWPRAAR
jgi:IS605 OrfB family transposase